MVGRDEPRYAACREETKDRANPHPGRTARLKKDRKFNALDRDCDLFWKACVLLRGRRKVRFKEVFAVLPFIAGMIPSSTVVRRDGKRKGEAVSFPTLEHHGVWTRRASGWSEGTFLAEFDERLVPNAPIQPLRGLVSV